MRPSLPIIRPPLLLLAALREVALSVLVTDLQVRDVKLHLLLVLGLHSERAIHVLLHDIWHLFLLDLLVSLGYHLIDELGGLSLVLSVTQVLVGDGHGRDVLSLSGG